MNQFPESPYKVPLRNAMTLNYLLAIIVLISLGMTAVAMFANPNC